MQLNPLVSVLMPCWNAADTLPAALASLKGQTYENWECILVDDGSTDNPELVVDAAADARIRYVRLDQNRGRGVARQTGLEMANGDFLAMLDADDWFYPQKLETQVHIMQRHPELVLVSAGMAIVDERYRLCGVRLPGGRHNSLIRTRMHKLGMPPVAFAPSMLRAERAKIVGFDTSYRIAEDVEFLLRFMLGEPFGFLPQIMYVYTEHRSITIAKVSEAFDQTRRMFSGYRSRYPLSSRINALKAAGKKAIYRIGCHAGLWRHLISRRSVSPRVTDQQDFRAAYDVVVPMERVIRARLRGTLVASTSYRQNF